MLYQLPKSEPQKLPLLLPISLRLESHLQPFLLLSGGSFSLRGKISKGCCLWGQCPHARTFMLPWAMLGIVEGD